MSWINKLKNVSKICLGVPRLSTEQCQDAQSIICFSFSNRTDELPIVSLEVNGVDYSFLIDTGATCSSISAKFYEGPLTNRTMHSVGVSGTDIICHMTPAIEVKVYHLPLFHKFVITPNLP